MNVHKSTAYHIADTTTTTTTASIATTTGASSPSTCSLLVVRQATPWQDLGMPNASNVVVMTSSLSSDVPIGEDH